MRVSGSGPVFYGMMVLALLIVVAGLAQVVSPSGSSLLGLVLILAALALSGYARNARAAYLHEQKMSGLWQWAQDLGPRGRRRP